MLRVVMVIGLWAPGLWLQSQALLPDVQERRLENGARVLLVERPGLGAVRAQVFLVGGKADTGSLPSPAADLLARCLFGPPLDGEAKSQGDLEALLKWEEGVHESLRTELLKRARQPNLPQDSESLDLERVHRQLLERFRKLGAVPDPMDAMGAGRREIRVEADLISYGADLPVSALGAWITHLAGRLKEPLLARFPLERQRLIETRDPESEKARRTLDVVLSTALPGQPYAQAAFLEPPAIEGLTWTAMRGYARRAVGSERIVVVLVGDVRMASTLPTLQATFGTLGAGPSDASLRDDSTMILPGGTGGRRIQVNMPGENRLLMGWRIPPRTHPDCQALQVLAQMLAGGELSRLNVRVRTHVPGGRDPSLLLVDGAAGANLGSSGLEQVIRSEVIRLQRGNFKEGEIRRAQRLLETAQVVDQEDAAELANGLGRAQCQGGDWRLAFRALQVKRDLAPQEIQGVALTFLVSDQSVIVMLEPDPILQPQDQVEMETARVLTRILEARLESPGKVEAVVRDALRQLRMLSLREREQTLRLLQSQVKP